MAAAPKNGTIEFTSLRNPSQKYIYSVYYSDVAAAFLTWATTGAAVAGSVNFITLPEDCVVSDMTISAAPTDTTISVLWVNDAPIRNTITADANIVNTIQTRNFTRAKIAGGVKVQFAQA